MGMDGAMDLWHLASSSRRVPRVFSLSSSAVLSLTGVRGQRYELTFLLPGQGDER